MDFQFNDLQMLKHFSLLNLYYPTKAIVFYVFRPLSGKHKGKLALRSLRLCGE